MSECEKCDQFARAVARVNKEPKRIIAFAAWYESGPPYVSRDKFEDLEEAWAALPDDGLQRVLYVYNHRHISPDGSPAHHLKGEAMGADWYWMFRASDGNLVLGFDQNITEEDIRERYPTAILKRGKWTSASNLDRIVRAKVPWL